MGITIRQHRSAEERHDAARRCCAALHLSMPLLVDTLDDRVGHAYSAMPDRLYFIDTQGKVAYQGGRGPFGFKPSELEQALVLLQLEEATAARPTGRLPVLANEEAWQRLPGAPAVVQPLPTWARMLAGPLPLTTARMLALDALHRSGNRLEPRLRGLVRWAAADANRCAYGQAIAAADLRRHGVSEATLAALTRGSGLTPVERVAVAFARRMMREAHSVTDAEVQHLLQLLGEERLVALVALLAHASFQDRLFLATNATLAPDEPLQPLTVAFARSTPQLPPVQTAAAGRPRPMASGTGADAAWQALQQGLEKQRARTGRIRVPSREEMLQRLGPGHPATRQLDILWSRVCYTLQPELTEAWFACVAAFRQEAGLERLVEQSLFWIVTRSLHCFY